MKISGEMKVKTLKGEFKKEFGLTLRVYSGGGFADEDAILASIRKNDAQSGELTAKKNIKIRNLEDKISEMSGLKIQIAGSDDSYLCNDNLTLARALVKDKKKIERRKNRSAISQNKTKTDYETEGRNNEEKQIIVSDKISSDWYEKLIKWADRININDDKIPRDKEKLLKLTELDLTELELTQLPKEIENLTNLTDLYLS